MTFARLGCCGKPEGNGEATDSLIKTLQSSFKACHDPYLQTQIVSQSKVVKLVSEENFACEQMSGNFT